LECAFGVVGKILISGGFNGIYLVKDLNSECGEILIFK
jgi:hypothetical protein